MLLVSFDINNSFITSNYINDVMNIQQAYLNTNTASIHTFLKTEIDDCWDFVKLAYNRTFISLKWENNKRVIAHIGSQSEIFT